MIKMFLAYQHRRLYRRMARALLESGKVKWLDATVAELKRETWINDHARKHAIRILEHEIRRFRNAAIAREVGS